MLDLLLDVVYGVRRLDIEGNGLMSNKLDLDNLAGGLKCMVNSEVKSALLANVVNGKGPVVLEAFTTIHQILHLIVESILLSDLYLDVFDDVERPILKACYQCYE